MLTSDAPVQLCGRHPELCPSGCLCSLCGLTKFRFTGHDLLAPHAEDRRELQ